jgi:diaminopimelate epimerase
MSQTIPFSIMSGAGNTFTVIDNRQLQYSIEQGKQLAPIVCKQSRNTFLDTEGLMFLTSTNNTSDSTTPNIRMEFFNPDGSHGAMCGNGGRCAAMFSRMHGFFPAEVTNIVMHVLDVAYEVEFPFITGSTNENLVRVTFPSPQRLQKSVAIPIGNATLHGGFVDVGSTHAVVWFEDIVHHLLDGAIADIDDATFSAFEIQDIGTTVRHHEVFAPEGVNCNIAFKRADGRIHVRTFERGVEAETGACGTGAIATALMSFIHGKADATVELITSAQQHLTVEIICRNDVQLPIQQVSDITKIVLSGGADVLHEGTISWNL